MNRFKTPAFIYLLYRAGFGLGFFLMVTASGLYYIEAVGCNAFQLVVLGTILEGACFLFEVPTGIVADRYSRKLSILLGLLIMSAGFVLEGSLPIFAFVALAQVIWGMGATFLSGADVAWLSDELGGAGVESLLTRGAKLGTAVQLAALPLGLWLYILTPGLPYWVGGAILVLTAFVLWRFMPEHHFKPAFQNHSGLAMWTAPLVQGWKQIRNSKVLLGIMGLALLGGLFSEGFDRLWPMRFLNGTGLPELGSLDARYIFLLIRGGALAATWGLLHWVETRQKRGVSGWMLLGILNLLLAAMLYGFARLVGFAWALAAFWPAWALRQAREPVMDGLLSGAITDNSVRATVISMKGQLDQLGQMLGGPLIGYVAWRWGVPAGLAVSGLWLLPLALGSVVLQKQVKQGN